MTDALGMHAMPTETEVASAEDRQTSTKPLTFRKGRSMRGTQFAQLTAFAAVAEYRSFTKAASSLGLSTPSLSHAIRCLEDEFGVRLFNRTTRSLALTEAGEQLLSHLSPVLEGVDRAIDAVNSFRNQPTGSLRLTVHPVAAATVIAPLVARFSDQYPSIELEISVDVHRKDIVNDRFDAGIGLSDDIAQDMIAAPIGSAFRPATVASPEYLARNADVLAPDDLRAHNCVRYRWDGEGPAQAWTFSKAGESIAVPVQGSLTVNTLDLALRAALDGVGIVQLPETLISAFVADGRLVSLLPDWRPQSSGFSLYYSSRRHVPIKLRKLVDFLRRESRQGLSAAIGDVRALRA